MLDVFWLPAFTHLGDDRQDLLSLCDVMECMCAHTRPWFILSSKRVFEERSQKPGELQRKKSPLLEAQRRVKPQTLHHTGQQAQHNTSLFQPPQRLFKQQISSLCISCLMNTLNYVKREDRKGKQMNKQTKPTTHTHTHTHTYMGHSQKLVPNM